MLQILSWTFPLIESFSTLPSKEHHCWVRNPVMFLLPPSMEPLMSSDHLNPTLTITRTDTFDSNKNKNQVHVNSLTQVTQGYLSFSSIGKYYHPVNRNDKIIVIENLRFWFMDADFDTMYFLTFEFSEKVKSMSIPLYFTLPNHMNVPNQWTTKLYMMSFYYVEQMIRSEFSLMVPNLVYEKISDSTKDPDFAAKLFTITEIFHLICCIIIGHFTTNCKFQLSDIELFYCERVLRECGNNMTLIVCQMLKCFCVLQFAHQSITPLHSLFVTGRCFFVCEADIANFLANQRDGVSVLYMNQKGKMFISTLIRDSTNPFFLDNNNIKFQTLGIDPSLLNNLATDLPIISPLTKELIVFDRKKREFGTLPVHLLVN